MSILDFDGLTNGDRLRACSDAARLHFAYLFLASNGYGRLEINYARLVGRVYATFNVPPSEVDLMGFVEEYRANSLLFLYRANGQVWGAWDTKAEYLPRYKNAQDRRSPEPPEPAFREWKSAYRSEVKALPKVSEIFQKVSEIFPRGVGVGVGVGKGLVRDKNSCASDDARLSDSASLPIEETPDSTEKTDKVPAGENPTDPKAERKRFEAQQAAWFDQWWAIYWLKKDRGHALKAFKRHVLTEERFKQVMEATRAQSSEMLSREPRHRPYGATWLNGERWGDEEAAKQQDGLEGRLRA